MDKIKEIRERYKAISLDDQGQLLNQTYIFANQFQSMLALSLVITKGALLRDEFRGSHFKPEFPNRDDEQFLKETLATYDQEAGEPKIAYGPIDMRHLKPIKRDYATAKRVKPKLENVPDHLELPIE